MRFFSSKLQQLLLKAAMLVSAATPAIMQASLPGDPMPLFTSFDWSAQPSYAIQGTTYNYVSGVGNVGSSPVTYVIDPPNQRILFDLTPHGKYYVFENESFVTGLFPVCARVVKADGSNFTFADQVAGYLNVTSTLYSTEEHPKYFGRAADVATCQDQIAVEVNLKNGFLSDFNYTQMVPVPGLGCAYITGLTHFNHSSISHHHLDDYFVLSSDCTDSAPSYCPLFYPEGNPCGNCQ